MPAATLARNLRRRRQLGILAALLFVASLVMLVVCWDWNWFKGTIERRVEAATGRRLTIGGRLDVDVDWGQATVRGHDIRFANAPWAKTPDMFEADAVELDLALWPLLRGKVVLPAARLERPRLLLERVDERPGNWMLDRPARRRFEIRQLLVSDGELRVRDAPVRTDLELDVESGKPDSDDALAPLVLRGRGRFRGFDFDLTGSIESPLKLRQLEKPYWVDLEARAGSTHAHARGSIETMAALREFDLAFELRGADLAQLDPLTGLVMPPTPPYKFDGQLQRRGDVWDYRDMHGRIGDSDMSGNATITYTGERPHLRAELVSQRLDIDDLGGFVGAPPSAAAGESATPMQRQEAAQVALSDRILPQRPYRPERLRAMDADVTLRAASVDAGSLPIESLEGHLLLDRGVARLDPLHLAVAGGRVDSRVELDASDEPIAMTADMTLRGLQLPKLFPDAKLAENSYGHIGGRLALAGRGNSVALMLATSDGEIGLVMGRGRISNLLLELAGLDVAESLRFMLGKDRVVPLRCAHADFAADDGVLTARTLAFDTTDTVLHGEGRIDLRDESLDLVLRPRPKDRSLISLRSPLVVDGHLKDPDIHPQAGPLALRGVAAAALYTIAPPASLLALIETGPGEDIDCTAAPSSAGGRERASP